MRLLVLRPQAGAAATAARCRAAGHDAVMAPLFVYHPVGWAVERSEAFDALLLTSAAAVRLGGAGLIGLRHLPVHAVGLATAAAARAAGFASVHAGGSDAQRLLDAMAAQGIARVLHLAGRAHKAVAHPAVRLSRVIVYRADPVAVLPAPAAAAIVAGATVLLHSPRAARTFAALLDAAGVARASVRLACFSAAVAAAAGSGWAVVAVAARPSDDALLAVATAVCDQGADRMWEPE